ncbi:MAG: lysylphosphatidylglycerol synthase transmembrane domain-containing protein [Polyangiaceae bacterium]
MADPETTEVPPTPREKQGIGRWVRLGFGVAGLIGLGALVASVGPRVILDTLEPALAWVPLIGALELGRIGSETLATWIALGEERSKIPRIALFRATLVGHAIANLAPAPRVVNETIKGTVVAPHVGVAAATSAGITMQAATLSCVGLFSIPCGIAIHLLGGASVWFWASMIHATSMIATGVAIRAVARAKGLGRWLAKRFPRLGSTPTDVSEHNARSSVWGFGPTLALFGNRTTQVIQLAIAAHAVGIDTNFARALAAQGVNLVAAAVGVMVPGGFGTTDTAFTLAAELLGTTVVKATAMALLMRCIQFIWLFIGSVFMMIERRRRAAPPTEEK